MKVEYSFVIILKEKQMWETVIMSGRKYKVHMDRQVIGLYKRLKKSILYD